MQNQQMNQSMMQSPPPAITSKDLQYLKDALSWELLAFKKFHFLAQQATNPNIKQALEKAGQMHQNHYQKLLSHLQVNNNTVLASMQTMQQNQQQNLQ
ncbi:ferritin-like domain-containing protein [Neobacillus mesonae]|uniref:Rubrerythrin family protein n=1 Tax=Neobacillus mesonae TaxID=1193713 RepID=A0A3T0HYJ3_9BACI|nr:ferritin-like domain-containing protein [Neobacillus mesonae]AZU62143.1 rubrerythrin family protein [Neobacillus mesonae]